MEKTEFEILEARKGRVLSKYTILKLDHYPKDVYDRTTESTTERPGTPTPQTPFSKSKKVKLSNQFSGALNFRKSDKLPIYGVSQPPHYSIKAMLNFLKKSEEKESVIWVNLREEPVIYINKRPFVLREYTKPYQNFTDYSGINTETIQRMEKNMKEDIVKEAAKYYGNIIVHDETYENEIVAYWESAGEDSVQTPFEVFQELKKNYNISYWRIPVTPEDAFKFRNYDSLLTCLGDNLKPNSSIVFNCQLGKGRSTNAMIIAYLVYLWKSKISGRDAKKIGFTKKIWGPETTGPKGTFDLISNYKIIIKLMRLLKYGKESMDIVDFAIDSCSEIVHFRESIHAKRMEANKCRQKEDKLKLGWTALKKFERYFYLIVFQDYLANRKFGEKNTLGFADYMQKIKKEITVLFDTEVEKNKKNPFRIFKTSKRKYEDLDDIDVVYNRKGTVLAAQSILKLDHFFDPIQEFDYLEGVPNWRKVEGFVCGSATPTVSGINKIIQYLKNSKFKDVCWINLREEPLIYVNNDSYVIRDIDNPFQNISTRGIKREELERLERRLKQDVGTEIGQGEGNRILLHDETDEDELSPFWDAVKTTSTILEEIEKANKIHKDLNISYSRVPWTTETHLTFTDMNNLTSHLISSTFIFETQKDGTRKIKGRKNIAIVFNCQFGLNRSTFGMVISWIFKKITDGDKTQSRQNIPEPSDDEYDYENSLPFETYIISSLLRLFRNGLELKSMVDNAINNCICGVEGIDIRNLIKLDIMKAETTRTKSASGEYLKRAAGRLNMYLLLMITTAYIKEQYIQSFSLNFLEWIKQRDELKSLFSELMENYDHIFIKKLPRKKLTRTRKNKNEAKILKERKGQVLSKNMLIKSDHFPGCQRKGLKPRLEGAPNFRKINGINVYGVAIPTTEGVRNLLDYIGGKKDKIIWINLREEPVIYIKGKPFVLRNLLKPLTNIEHTGIDYDRLELMEDRLKRDLGDEAENYGGSVLLHDEKDNFEVYSFLRKLVTKDGQDKEAIKREILENSAILTPRDLYTSVKKEGYKVKYLRIPITDEQAPKFEDFDELLTIFKDVDILTTHLVFNCQMGRGRTTTGIVLSNLLFQWKKQLAEGKTNTLVNPKPNKSNQTRDDELRNGNYQIIIKLLRVLNKGIQNKEQVDSVLDLCSQMQNLRSGVLDFIKRSENESKSKHYRDESRARAINYLKRYFLLIVFNEYLREHCKSTDPKKNFIKSFKNWIDGRFEITNLLKNVTLK